MKPWRIWQSMGNKYGFPVSTTILIVLWRDFSLEDWLEVCTLLLLYVKECLHVKPSDLFFNGVIIYFNNLFFYLFCHYIKLTNPKTSSYNNRSKRFRTIITSIIKISWLWQRNTIETIIKWCSDFWSTRFMECPIDRIS